MIFLLTYIAIGTAFLAHNRRDIFVNEEQGYPISLLAASIFAGPLYIMAYLFLHAYHFTYGFIRKVFG